MDTENIFSKINQTRYELTSQLNYYKTSKKNYEDFIKDKNINVILNNENIKNIDDSVIINFKKEFGESTSLYLTTYNKGSYPHFIFKPNNKIISSKDYTIKITLRWAGTPESYNFHKINEKKWCIGFEETRCKTNKDNMPPINGNYVTYSFNFNNYYDNLTWIKWLISSPLSNNEEYPIVFEFKSIIFEFNSENKLKMEQELKDNYNNIISLFNILNNDIQTILNYDMKQQLYLYQNIDRSTIFQLMEDLKKENVDFIVSNHDSFNAQNIDMKRLINSNRLMYGGVLLLNFIIIMTLFKQLST